MNQVMLVQGIESLLADPVLRAEHLRDVALLDRLMAPRAAPAASPSWPKPAVALPTTYKAAALLLVRSNRRGGFSFSVWHGTRLSGALDGEQRRGVVQVYPLPADIAGLSIEAVVCWAFARVEVP